MKAAAVRGGGAGGEGAEVRLYIAANGYGSLQRSVMPRRVLHAAARARQTGTCHVVLAWSPIMKRDSMSALRPNSGARIAS